MIYIEENEKVNLPKKYHKINNVCAFIYDQLTEIFAENTYKGLLSTKFNIQPNLMTSFQDGTIHPLDLLKQHQLDDELTTILTKHITMSIVSDMVNFIYESLSCAKKGKMTVAYALLRKPFTDELLILEQLLYDPKDFINRFFHLGNIEEYDPSLANIDKKKIIENALIKIQPSIYFTSELIYGLRFDKSNEAGINGISNKALHIVTRDKNYKTQNQNFNFVFSNKEDVKTYWNHYYYFVPYLLAYTVCVVDSLIFSYLPEKENKYIEAIKSLKRQIGLVIWNEEMLRRKSKKIFESFSKVLNLECKKCKEVVVLTKDVFELFFETEVLICEKCANNLLESRDNLDSIVSMISKLSK